MEKFAQALVKTGNQSEAYREAYNALKMKPETVHRAAHELMQNPNVAARIAELRAAAAKRNEITVDDLVAELEEARQAGLGATSPQAAAAVAATMGKAKILGFLIDKGEITGKDGTPLQPPELVIVIDGKRTA